MENKLSSVNGGRPTFASLEELESNFSKKINFLKTCLELRNIDQSTAHSVENIHETVQEMRVCINHLKELASEQQKALQKLKVMKSQHEDMANRIAYIQGCIPAVPVNKNTLADVTNIVNSNSLAAQQTSNMASENKSRKAKSKVVPKVLPLSSEEFALVSNYMKGRLSLEDVNKIIDSFNKSIECKYKLINTSRCQLAGESVLKVKKYKDQQSDETKGIFFCDVDDLKDFASLKQDNRTKNSLIIMRHCSRIREIRGPGTILRLAIIPRIDF